MKPSSRTGFTLIELMVVVAILGILAAVAIPKFSALIRKSGEGACKGSLGAIRSALSIYYSDMEGQYPDNLTALTVSGKYLSALPSAHVPDYHPATSSEQVSRISAALGDFGGWMYYDMPTDSNYGGIIINCTHTDTKGAVWTAY